MYRKTGISTVGLYGLDYGTGLHEAAHALDFAMSKPEYHTFAEAIMNETNAVAGKKLFRESINQIIGGIFLDEKERLSILSDPSEVFAYSLETALGGVVNSYASIVLTKVKEKCKNGF